MKRLGVAAPALILFLVLAFWNLSGGGRMKPVPVNDFDLQKYLGTWYEIARMPAPFEKDLARVTAHYSLRKDGKVRVLNQGYRKNGKGALSTAVGKARFEGNPATGYLKVSFFGPFYADYDILALDPDYRYALVGGGSPRFLWILSRSPELPEAVRSDYLERAAALGYEVSRLIWVRQGE